MNLSSSVLKNRAKIKLQGMYGQSLLVTLIYTMCISAVSSIGGVFTFLSSGLPMLKEAFSAMENGGYSPDISGDGFNFQMSFSPFSSLASIAMLLVGGPMAVGLAHYFLRVTDRNNPQLGDLFAEFKNFGNTVLLTLLTGIFTFLWSLLFIIPGIIAGLSYAMAPYIMAEHPEIGPMDALRMSKDMMRGNKGDYFLLHLSFIGWYLLCVLTLGVGFIFLSPYVETAAAEFFNEVSGKNVEKRNAGIDPDAPAPFAGGINAQQQGGYGYAQPPYANGATPSQETQDFGGFRQPQGFNGYAQPQAEESAPQPFEAAPPQQNDGGNEPPQA